MTMTADALTTDRVRSIIWNLADDVLRGLIENSQMLGLVFHSRLSALKERFPDHIKCVQGVGLLAALIFSDPNGVPLVNLCNGICIEAMHSGLLVVHTGRESIKLAPPLSISEDALMEGLEVLEEAISESIAKESRAEFR